MRAKPGARQETLPLLVHGGDGFIRTLPNQFQILRIDAGVVVKHHRLVAIQADLPLGIFQLHLRGPLFHAHRHQAVSAGIDGRGGDNERKAGRQRGYKAVFVHRGHACLRGLPTHCVAARGLRRGHELTGRGVVCARLQIKHERARTECVDFQGIVGRGAGYVNAAHPLAHHHRARKRLLSGLNRQRNFDAVGGEHAAARVHFGLYGKALSVFRRLDGNAVHRRICPGDNLAALAAFQSCGQGKRAVGKQGGRAIFVKRGSGDDQPGRYADGRKRPRCPCPPP